VYRVSGGAGLALTTARYYTPSGRLIQRPWDGTFDEYLTYSLKDQKEREKSADQLKYTSGGRKVYSGGGIEPDLRFDGPVEGFNPTRFGRMLYARQEFENYAQSFSADGDTRIAQQGHNQHVVKPGFVVDDAMLAGFRDQLKTDHIRIDEAAFTKDIDFIRAMIRFQIEVALSSAPGFSIAEARKHLITVDPQAQAAFQSFGEAVKLTELAKASTKAGH